MHHAAKRLPFAVALEVAVTKQPVTRIVTCKCSAE